MTPTVIYVFETVSSCHDPRQAANMVPHPGIMMFTKQKRMAKNLWIRGYKAAVTPAALALKVSSVETKSRRGCNLNKRHLRHSLLYAATGPPSAPRGNNQSC